MPSDKKQAKTRTKMVRGGMGGLWLLGFIGALVYYWHTIDSFWTFIVAVFKSVFWVAYLVYGLFHYLAL